MISILACPDCGNRSAVLNLTPEDRVYCCNFFCPGQGTEKQVIIKDSKSADDLKRREGAP